MDDTKIISRDEARRLGLKRYFDGLPCKHGHISQRAVVNRKCLACGREWYRERSPTYEKSLAAKERAAIARREVAQRKAEREATREARAAAYRERQRAQAKAWRETNRERFLELQRNWRLANREKRRADRKARKVEKRKTTISGLMKEQKGRCAYCRSKLGPDRHLDHVIPRALGGSNRRSNLQLLCPPCNLSKHAKHPIDFAQGRGMLL